MASKILAQLVLASVQIVGRAFVTAYRQAAANAPKQGARPGAAAAGEASSGAAAAPPAASISEQLTRKTGMSLDEAQLVLNAKDLENLEGLRRNYEHLFKVNDRKAGGSFYLQSKVVRAKERIEMELKQVRGLQGVEISNLETRTSKEAAESAAKTNAKPNAKE